MIGKPLQTLIQRFEEASSVLSDNRPNVHYVEHPNAYSNSREFYYGAYQSTLLMRTKPVTRNVYECTNSLQQFSFQNGHETGDYNSGYVNRDQNGMSNANARSDDVRQSLIEPQCNGQYRYNFEDSLPTDGQIVASRLSNIHQSHEDHINEHSLPKEIVANSLESTNLLLQQATDTTQERYRCVDAENICRHQCTDQFLCDGNYKLALEAIQQLENDNTSDQQQVADITTTIDTQTNTPAREHLEAAPTHQTVRTEIESSQMETPAIEQPSEHKESRSEEESLSVSVSCSDVIGNKRDLTKSPGNSIDIKYFTK